MWRAVVLGSAQDGGLPQLGADLRNDRRARAGDLAERYSSSVAVVHEDGRALLLDAGPDIRGHERVLRSVHDRRGRTGFVDGVVLTHGHMGHYAGLLQFGRESAGSDRMPVWASPMMCAFLRANSPWRLAVEQGHLQLHPTRPGSGFAPWPDLSCDLIEVPHRNDVTDTVAVSVEGLLYLPDIDAWDEWDRCDETIGSHGTALLDATFHYPAELPGRDISRIPHPLVGDTVARFARLLEGTDIVLTHLNHSNPLCDPDSAEAAAARNAGFVIAEEGMTFAL